MDDVNLLYVGASFGYMPRSGTARSSELFPLFWGTACLFCRVVIQACKLVSSGCFRPTYKGEQNKTGFQKQTNTPKSYIIMKTEQLSTQWYVGQEKKWKILNVF